LGDRYDRDVMRRRRLFGRTLPHEPILAWGLPKTGHNGGPPFEEEPGYLWRRYRWAKAHAEAWKTPSLAIVKFRVARAAAAGMTYEEYVSVLLDTGCYPQAGDPGTRKEQKK
jgi:hypothetical protein